MMGPRWRAVRDEIRGLDQPADGIRREIVMAEAHGVLVVRVLVDAATMPGGGPNLPEPSRSLCRRHTVEIRDSHVNHDVDSLIAQLETTGLRRIGAGRGRVPSG